MTTVEGMLDRSRRLATRFLQTAVVVDDEAYMGPRAAPDGPVEAPHPRVPTPDNETREERPSHRHQLDASAMIGSFAKLGIICGVIGPSDEMIASIRQADIVVLDWRLKRDEPDSDYALDLLKRILLREPDRNALRLIAFYTGESRLREIQEKIVDRLGQSGFEPEVLENGIIGFGHSRVVLYAKEGVNLPPSEANREVAEANLPDKLVQEFAAMTIGLLPGIALVSLSAVRECAHVVLDRFSSELDPAFLAHRICLPNPEDAEGQIANLVAEELRGVMEYAVADTAPAGDTSIEAWVRHQATVRDGNFLFGDKSFDVDQAVALAKKNLKDGPLGARQFMNLSAGFGAEEGCDADERLAWTFTSRTIVFDEPPPILWLGTILSCEEEEPSHLICMRPRCDSMRLKECSTPFFFLPLIQTARGKQREKLGPLLQHQVVVQIGQAYERRMIAVDPARWTVRQFRPDTTRNRVLAQRDDLGRPFFFKDVNGKRYNYQGELKSEFAHRIAQSFGETFTRVPVDDSEWLRRYAQRDAN